MSSDLVMIKGPQSSSLAEALAIAVRHQQCGRLQAAEQIYRQILAAEPNHADALHLLGVLASQAGRHEAAIEHIQRAIQLQGGAACFHNNLGEVYRTLHRNSEAVACYRRALELRPGFAEAYSNLGVALREQGETDEAVACYRRAVELRPEFAEAYCNLGNALREQRKLDEAVTCWRRALELKPDFAEACTNLGVVLKDLGRLDEALAYCRQALELKPDDAESYSNLGVVFKEQGKLDVAGACYRRALELKPDYAEAHGNLGSLAEEMGDLQGAEDFFRAALRHNSRFALAHYKLAGLLGGKLPENDLAAQRRLLEEGELPDAQRSWLHFGLAQVLDARREYAAAAEHLDRANALQLCEWCKRGQAYDPKQHEILVDRMLAVCTPDFFVRMRGFELEGLALESELPVFIVGLPRSGTTLVEQILAGHSRIFAAGQIKLAGDTLAALGEQGADPIDGLGRLDRPTAFRLASRHLDRLLALSPAARRIVDKTSDNYLLLGMLAGLFPRAKFIHCRRNLRDAAVSCWMTHFPDVRWANDQEHIASRFHEYRRMMEHWRKVLPAPIMEVDYEETVADLEGVARRLVAWCGLEWEPACLEFHRTKRPVRTASAVQVRQPVYRTSVGRWRRYEQALAPLFAGLERMP
jgi:tetratricopeptide (TPR) repeat protein